jgi:TonB family protein
VTRRSLRAAAALALLLASAAAPRPPAVRARPADSRSSLAGLISSEDYPPAALRAEQQGTVRVRLDVGIDGRVSACTVLESSHVESLDAATCRILQTRAVFTPARDRRGRPVPDTFTQSIAWRIEEESTGTVVAEAVLAWSTCLGAEARAQVQDAAGIGPILDRAFERCKTQEAAVLVAMNADRPSDAPLAELPKELREGMRHSIAEMLLALRYPHR